jgi:hypothetical protein
MLQCFAEWRPRHFVHVWALLSGQLGPSDFLPLPLAEGALTSRQTPLLNLGQMGVPASVCVYSLRLLSSFLVLRCPRPPRPRRFPVRLCDLVLLLPLDAFSALLPAPW